MMLLINYYIILIGLILIVSPSLFKIKKKIDEEPDKSE